METNLNAYFFSEIERLRDPDYRDFHRRLTHTRYPLEGVRIPDLRRLAKEIARRDDREEFLALTRQSYEQVMVKGLVIAAMKCDLLQRVERLDAWLEEIDDWALNDVVQSSVKEYSDAYFDFVSRWTASDHSWKARFGITSMMTHFTDGKHFDRALEDVLNASARDYYVDMAKAWYLQNAALKFPDRVIEVLKSDCIDATVKQMTVRKIKDSFRLCSDYKALCVAAIAKDGGRSDRCAH